MSTVPSTPRRTTRTGVLVAAGVAAFFVLAFPVAVELDHRLDRTRPMYDDRAEMVWLQYQSVVTTGRGRPVTLEPGESTEVAGQQFAPSAGVSIAVRADEPDAPCVRGSNDHGDVTEWLCVDLEKPPVDPSPDEVDPAAGEAS